jgi:DNA-binding CsgD family transcriptional regulator
VTRGWPALFWEAFKRSQTPMALIDSGRHHVEVNGAYLNLVARRRAALIGHPVYEIVQDGPLLTDEEWQEALEAREATGNVPIVCGDGRTVLVEYAAHPEVVSGRRLVLFVAIHVERRRRSARPRRLRGGGDLSPRELEIVRLVAQGKSGPQIAAELHISYATVRTHLRNAQAKLGAQSRAQLVAMTVAEGQLAA